MTTRFSVAELAEMLNSSVEHVRQAVSELHEQDVLTKETFLYLERNWRIAPSDVKKVQEWLEQAEKSGRLASVSTNRRIKRKRVLPNQEPESPSDGG